MLYEVCPDSPVVTVVILGSNASADPSQDSVDALSDADLYTRFRTTGDQEAFTVLFHKYRNLCLTVGYNILGNHYRSEDMMQGLFTDIALGDAVPPLGFTSQWLMFCMRNRCLDCFRAMKSSPEKLSLHEVLEPEDPRDTIATVDFQDALDCALHRLDLLNADGANIIRAALGGTNAREFSDETHINHNTVMFRQQGARKQLRVFLMEAGVDISEIPFY